jgi:hypothetical protein
MAKLSLLFILCFVICSWCADLGSVPIYSVKTITFLGPNQTSSDKPAANIDFYCEFKHESGSPTYKVHGFWDGDGNGGKSGSVFKVRFCPTKTGRWNIVNTHSTNSTLNNQKEGDYVTGTSSSNHGFWIPQGRWFKRSDGSAQYWFGNTHYDFLCKRTETQCVSDINGNAGEFGKIRFCLMSFRSENENYEKTFLTGSGTGESDRKTYADRPNPKFFKKVDAVVNAALAKDIICDLILGGTYEDQVVTNSAYLKYVAARYGAYANVWICLANEWNEQTSASAQKATGTEMDGYLPYPTPISTHGTGGWNSGLNGSWCTHAILQGKISDLTTAADRIVSNVSSIGGKPAVNDENGYQGEAPTSNKATTIEGLFGSFMGGGYGTTGEKFASKQGQYFWGNYSTASHSAAPCLGYVAAYITNNVNFRNLSPTSSHIFSNTPGEHKVLGDGSSEYILGSNGSKSGIVANLGSASWKVVRVDIDNKSTTTLSSSATGSYTFNSTGGTCLIHFKKNGTNPDPVIAANPSSVTTSMTLGAGNPSDIQVTINNSGSGTLSWSAAENPAVGWLSLSGTSGSAGGKVTLSFNGSGLSEGTHSTKVRVTAANAANSPFDIDVTFNVSAPTPLTIKTVSSELSTAYINTYYADDLEADGGTAPYTWSATGLPAGLTVKSGGSLEGTPTSTGTYNFMVTVKDAASGSVSKQLALVVAEEPQTVKVTLVNYLGSNTAPTIVEEGFVEGADQANDRTSTWSNVPAELAGLTYLLTARDDKSDALAADAVMYRVSLSMDATVYCLIDGTPSWLAADGWVLTSITGPTGNNVVYKVYSKSFSAGTIDLKRYKSSGSQGTSYVFEKAGTQNPVITDNIRLGFNGQSIHIYPNPFSGIARICLIQNSNIKMQNVKLAIFDPAGRVVHESCDVRRATYIWDAAKQASGNYIIRVNAGDKILQKRVNLVR